MHLSGNYGIGVGERLISNDALEIRIMIFDIETLRAHYASFPQRVTLSREKLGRAMTLAEKILYAHLYDEKDIRPMKRGSSHGDAIFEATHGIAPDKIFISKR